MFDQFRMKIVTVWVLVGAGLFLLAVGLPTADSSRYAENSIPSLAGIEPVLVPTLGQWGLLLLALAMMGVAFWVIRKNPASKG
ncbi:MAG: IPTL-CTERM sorting domain-containing protein [Myxococcota bacterium]|nr:IPTL-CTERM sorting domain-containing protein [Myxococcota bacterium]